MTQGLRSLRKESTALGMATLILLGALLTGINPIPGGSLPDARPALSHAQVKIKTQEAADSIVGGIRGIDVSKYQGKINWERVARDNVNFVMVRASIGNEIDEEFVRNAQGAHDNGILVGAYHYAKFTNRKTMLEEARNFIGQLQKVEITYPVALDIEAHRNLKRDDLTSLCIQFMEEVKDAGYDVMLYTYNNFLLDFLNRDALDGYRLWIANYNEEPFFGQYMWQHTSYGSVSGINGRVDINIAYEDLNLNKRRKPKNVVKVNGTISRSIKQTLNERYSSGLNLEVLDMAEMNSAVAVGLQKEVNKQFGVKLPIQDSMTKSAMDHLTSINYVKGKTKGNITYLIQVKLFYKGLYTGYPSGEYDDATAEAIKAYQNDSGMQANGKLNTETVQSLLW